MLRLSIRTSWISILSKLYCFDSRRTKLQQQSSQLEELERQRAEIANLQEVSFCPSHWKGLPVSHSWSGVEVASHYCIRNGIICVQHFLFAHIKSFFVLSVNNELDNHIPVAQNEHGGAERVASQISWLSSYRWGPNCELIFSITSLR